MTVTTRKVNALTNVGAIQDGDILVGERVDGTTVRITYTGSTTYTDEAAQDAVGSMVDSSLTYVDGTPLLQRAALTGDVTASAGSNATTIANDAVTYAKMQNVSATDKLLGRSTALAGDVEEITCTAAGRAILDDADASAQRTTLGVAIGTNVQAYDAELAALAGLTSAADKLPYFTGSGTAALADLSSAMRTFLTASSSANLKAVTTDETGSGALVFADTPTLVTPVLGAATATSINFGDESLSTYDTGTFTPTFTLATVGDLSVSYATQSGTYHRVGDRYDFEYYLSCTPTFTTGSGVIRLGGLPFTTQTANNQVYPIVTMASNNFTWSPSTGVLYAISVDNATYLQLQTSSSAASQTSQTAATSITSGVAQIFRAKGTLFL